jgi:hypothetical protein
MAPPPGPDTGTSEDAGTSTDTGVAPDASTPDVGGLPDAGVTTSSVLLKYRPSWGGVMGVAVFGAFGQATDWTMPFASLADDGTGTYTATVTLPAGTYAYLFRIMGDSAGSNPARVAHSALDPTNPTVAVCPPGSPSYVANPTNPCSMLSVPALPPSTLYHVRGSVHYDSAAIGGYLVLIERVEMGLHHFYVDRMDAASDGSVDFMVAPGKYRFQVLHPTYYSKNDAQRDPLMLMASRRAISGGFAVASMDVDVAPPAQVAMHSYSTMMPTTGMNLSLPVTFDWQKETGASASHAAVYESASTTAPMIGDPWYTSRSSSVAVSASWDGTFNQTTVAKTASVTAGKVYYWGTSQAGPRPATGEVSWTQESMVFPISVQ